MSDEYQRGSDIEWLKHSNEELAKLVKKRAGQNARLRLLCVLLLAALGWVVFKYQQKFPIETLWRF
jgi:hypothetical protein